MTRQRSIVLALLISVALAAALLVWMPVGQQSVAEDSGLSTAQPPTGMRGNGGSANAEPDESRRTAVDAASLGDAPAPVARMLEVKIVDTMSVPVADMTISAVDGAGDSKNDEQGSSLGKTDTNGHARIDLAELRFDTSGFAMLSFDHSIFTAPPAIVTRYSLELLVTAEESGKLVLRVVDEFHRPIPKAKIERGLKLDRGREHRVIAAWLTDAEGVVTIPGLLREVLHLRVRADGFARKDLEIPVHPKAHAERVVQLERGAELLVTVVDPASAAVEEVDLLAFDPVRRWSGYEWHGRSDELGVVTFTSLPRWLNEIHLIAKHQKFEKSKLQLRLEGRTSTRTEMRLIPAGQLHVHVTDERGATPTGWVSAHHLDLMHIWDEYLKSTPIGADGMAVLGGIPEGLAVSLKVSQDRHIVAVRTGVEVGADKERKIEITIPATIDVGFELRDEAGRRLTGNVALKSTEGRKTPGLMAFGKTQEVELRYSARAELHAAEPIHVRSGQYRVSAQLDTGPLIELSDLTLLESQTVRLTVEDSGRTLGGRLTDGSGRPLGDEVLRLSGFPGLPLTITDADGKFRFEGLAEGLGDGFGNRGFGNLQILDPIIGAVTLLQRVAPGPDIDPVYRRLPLRGRVREFDKIEHRGASIHVVQTAGLAIRGFGGARDPRVQQPPMSDDQGRFQLLLPAGTYKLSARGDGMSSAEASAVLAEGSATPDFELVVFRQAWLRLGDALAAGPAARLAVSVRGVRESWRHDYDLPTGTQRSTWRVSIPAGKVSYRLLDDQGKLVQEGETMLTAGKMRPLSR